MPLMPSVAQVFAQGGPQSQQQQQQQPQPPQPPATQRQDPTTAAYQAQRKSPQYSPPTLPRSTTDLPADRPLPLPLQQQQQPGQHSVSHPNLSAAMHPRPVQRVPPPQIIRQFEEMAESEQMTAEQLLAHLTRAHQTSPKEASRDRPDPALQTHSPERRPSPVVYQPGGPNLKRDSPPVLRNKNIPTGADFRPPHDRSPQIQARTPDRDRSLPVQEEQDDPRGHYDSQTGGRDSRTGHRSDDQTLINTEPEDKEEETDGESAFTPRSLAPSHLPSDGQTQSQPSRPQVQELNQWRAYHDMKRVPNYYGHAREYPDYLDYTDAAFLQSYMASSPRPDLPIPITPDNQSASAPSPSPLAMSTSFAESEAPIPSPVPPVGSPYPFPFSHVSRSHVYMSRQPAPPSTVDDSIRPSIIQDIKAQVAKQWNVYALNNNVEPSESAFSPSSTPAVHDDRFAPWANLHMQRTLGGPHPDLRSLQSSPSHEPVAINPPRMVGLRRKARSMSLRKGPPRVDSTVPRDTSPEPSSSGEETAGEHRYSVGAEESKWANGRGLPVLMPLVTPPADDAEWVDEEPEDEEDLLQLEYHPSFIKSVEKRRRRWRMHWDAITEAFQTLDQQTDSTLIVLAAPSHTNKLYALTSRSIRRENGSRPNPVLHNIRANFSQLAARRRINRAQPKASLASQLLSPSLEGRSLSGSGDGREEELRKALEAAVGTLGTIYEEREARWREEVKRANDEKDKVELLLKQVFGVTPSPTTSINGGSGEESSSGRAR